MKQKHLHTIIDIWANVCRYVLSVVFIFSGFVKAVDPLGTMYKIQDYLKAMGMISLVSTVLPFLSSLFIAVFEFCLGVYMLFGIRRRISTYAIFIIMVGMTLLTLWLAIANPISDCGCFGDAIKLTNWQAFGKNVFLLIAAITVFKWGNVIIPLISKRFDWLVGIFAFLFVCSVMLYSLYELPVFDFRPYHIGANIKESMTIPEGKSPTLLETYFIMEKAGKRREFTVDNYPDSTWTFVNSKTVVKKKGYEPPIRDFSIILQRTGEDITEQVLEDERYTFLLVAHQLSIANDSSVDLINELYDYCEEKGYPFYCLTASTDSDIIYWQECTGAEYPFAIVDDTILRTMIRSNPGLILLRKGIVINKWSVNSIPDEFQLTDRLENLPLAKINRNRFLYRILLMAEWLFIPLLLFILVDFAWGYYRDRKIKR